jgi:hypothetical protein
MKRILSVPQLIHNKNFYRSLLLVLGIILPFKLFAQDYFQQRVNYNIRVTLNDIRHELSGFEKIEYTNNSPDTLSFLYFHLWPNAYSSNKTALADELIKRDGKSRLFNDPDLKGYIDSLDFNIENQSIKWDLLKGIPDICKLFLKRPLKPGDSIVITTPFHIKIPGGGISRLGHTGESYQISQWYPKPAVYDKTGWHQMPYLDQGEFFSEFGSFKVSITLPSNYVVGATGNLANREEINWLDNLASDTAWMRIPDYINDAFPPSTNQTKTLTYTENNIHDFAWFADKRFHVLKGSVNLPESGRKVTTWAMFTNKEAYLWRKAIFYINNSIWYFSKWNGDYPYDSFTAVQSTLNSGDGMEYPGLTVVSGGADPYLLEEVLCHEICHSWFYSALGSDERRFPFMDESITSANESRYMQLTHAGKKLWEVDLRNRKLAVFFHAEDIPILRERELEWLIPARMNLEQSINLPATRYNSESYGSIIYSKAPQGFSYLRSYLGDSVYDNIMHDYYGKWKNKHPMPDDLKLTFESHTNKDLSWFFDDFLGTTKRLDYKVADFKNGQTLIKNKGELNGPLILAEMKGDSIVSERWEEGFTGSKWFDTGTGDYSEIRIDPQHKMTELFRLNNNIRTSGLFRKADPLRFQLLYAIEDPDKRYLIYLPAFNWTAEDGFMVGVALHSADIIPKPFEYFILPFYAFHSEQFTGYGKISLNCIPYNGFFRLITLSLDGGTYGAPGTQNYHIASIGADFFLRSYNENNLTDQKVTGYFATASDLRKIITLTPANMLSYVQLGYQIKSKNLNPYNMDVLFESGNSYQKASVELNYKYSYGGKKSGFETRIFAGTMLEDGGSYPFYSLSPGGRSGTEQYLYQGIHPDRFSVFPTTFWSRQMSLSEGGLVSPVNDSLGFSRWLISITLSSSLPGKANIIPVKPFINLLLNDHGTGANKNPALFFEAGLKAGVWDFFEVYFPFIVSENINSITGSFKERIRFMFKLDKLNLFSPKSHSSN